MDPGQSFLSVRYRKCLSGFCFKFLWKFPRPEKAKAVDPLRPGFKSWGSPTVFQGPQKVPWGLITERCGSPVISSAAHCHRLSAPQVNKPRGSSWGTVSFLRPEPKLFPACWLLTQCRPWPRGCAQYLLSDKRRHERQLVGSLEPLLRFLVQGFPRCPLVSGCRLQPCKCGECVLPQGRSQAWRCKTLLTVGVLAREHHGFQFLGNFSNMEKLMSSLSSHLWCKKKSGQDFALTENLWATEGYFSRKGSLSRIIFKRQFIIRSSCQRVPEICTLCMTQKRKHNI